MMYPLNIFLPDPSTGSIRPSIIFMTYQLDFNMTKAKSWSDSLEEKTLKDFFVLPMPEGGLTDSSSNNYSSEPSVGGAIAVKAMNAFNGAIEGGSMGVLTNASQRMGISPDPKETQLYSGSSPRSWSGTWTMIPQSMAESAAIAAILYIIKKAAAPDKADFKNKIGVLLQPYVFKIIFSNPILNAAMQFDQMAIKNYSIRYFAQGYASTYFDMMPKQIELSMDFAEFGIKTRKDWMF